MAETRAIMKMSRLAGVRDPTSALWSIRELDVCIRAFGKKNRAEGKDRDRATLQFMENSMTFANAWNLNSPNTSPASPTRASSVPISGYEY